MNEERREYDPEIERRLGHSRLRAEYIITDYVRKNPDKPLARAMAEKKFSWEEAYELLNEFARDPKTGVLRSDFLPYTLEYEAQHAREHEGEPLTVGIIDIDDFKLVNSELGYQGADEVLQKVATIIAKGIRQSDETIDVTEEGSADRGTQLFTDDVVRFGGEEFIVIFSSTNLQQARVALERIRVQIEHELGHLRPADKEITVSAGLSMYDAAAREEWTDTLQRANTALTDAKHQGKNVIFPLLKTEVAK